MPIIERLTDVPGVATAARYAHAVTATGKFAFIAGQVAMDADGNLVGPGDFAAQTRQSLRNLESVLTALGAGWSDVVRFNWYLIDASQVQILRDVRDEFIKEPNLAASTLIQVAGLFKPDYLVEVDAVVAVP
ncbi:MAG TPA: enamine deaminase RidA [Micromonosporaceae bacterium]|nr:enamine deaminase RidA [Micromonosporaceae bacterium]HCU51546.1 enamine deaminase RidA [Micromonosporaceae bacterium]